jgi:hypothetical protein
MTSTSKPKGVEVGGQRGWLKGLKGLDQVEIKSKKIKKKIEVGSGGGVGLKVGSHEGWVLGPRWDQSGVDLDLGFGLDQGGVGAQSGVT